MGKQETPLAEHESRLTRELRQLLHAEQVASLGTLAEDGLPFVSMVPYAIDHTSATLVIHVSALAAHTSNMQRNPNVSLMVMQREVKDQPVQATQRITLSAQVQFLERQTARNDAAKKLYLQRFPDVEHITELPDFRFVEIHITGARQVAGFGAARSVDQETLGKVLRSA